MAARAGQNRQAVAAVENALLDIKGKSFDAPVAELLGGYVRETVPVYWSHCGTYRTAKYGPHLNVPPLLDYDQVVTFAKEVLAESYSVPVAPHNFYGHLLTAISAQFAAAVPNHRGTRIDQRSGESAQSLSRVPRTQALMVANSVLRARVVGRIV